MTTPEDCRRKAEQWSAAAETASDPITKASLRRVSDLWMRLACEIERPTLTNAQMKPRGLAGPRIDAVQIGDILRDRLRISEEEDGTKDNFRGAVNNPTRRIAARSGHVDDAG